MHPSSKYHSAPGGGMLTSGGAVGCLFFWQVEVKIERGPLPAVEWWDKPLLKTGAYVDVEHGSWNVKSDKVRVRCTPSGATPTAPHCL
jgi:hypothetical protein